VCVSFYLVGGLEHLFFHILGIIIPIEQYFSEGLKPLTSFVGRFVPIKMKITGWFKHMTTVLEG